MENKEPPWLLWKHLSQKAEAVDRMHQGCNHNFYLIPFTINHLINSKISIPTACENQFCTAVDQYLSEKDILHISKFSVPRVKAVNFQNNFVLNEKGVLQGPYEFHEWLEYSYELWDLFHDIINDPKVYNKHSKNLYWSKLYFRALEDFTAGSYNWYSQIHLLMINSFHDLDSKHRYYSEVHRGADVWTNLEPLDIQEAKKFRNDGSIFRKISDL